VEEIRFLYLSQEDIVSLHLSWQEIIGRVELGLREHGEKTVENPPKPGVHSKGNSFIHAMPAYLKKVERDRDEVGEWLSGQPKGGHTIDHRPARSQLPADRKGPGRNGLPLDHRRPDGGRDRTDRPAASRGARPGCWGSWVRAFRA
jgi:hypothetical protein